MRFFAGIPAMDPPLRRHRIGCSLRRPPSCAPFHSCRHVHFCPATPLSPPGVLHQPHLSSLGSGFTTSSHHHDFSRQQAICVLGIPGFPAAALSAIFWESVVKSPRPTTATTFSFSVLRLRHTFGPPLQDDLLTATLPGFVPTPASLKNCCWPVG